MIAPFDKYRSETPVLAAQCTLLVHSLYLLSHKIDGMIPVKGKHGLWLTSVNCGKSWRLQAGDVRLHAVGHGRHGQLLSVSATTNQRIQNSKTKTVMLT
jgi:hypothetical protein